MKKPDRYERFLEDLKFFAADGKITAGSKEISDGLPLSEKSVRKYTCELHKRGLIDIEVNPENQSRRIIFIL